MSTPQIMEPSACTWCGIAERGHARQYADAVGYHAWAQPSQEQILARMKARRLQLAVARAGAYPTPVGGVRTLDVVEAELTGVNLALWEEIQAYARLRLALTSAQRGRRELRAQVAALLEERHSTNEALSKADEALRVQRDRIAELESLLAEDGCSCPPAVHPHQVGCPLDLPAPGSSERPVNSLTAAFAPVAALREALSREEPHDSPLHQAHRLGHDLELPSEVDPGDRLLGGDELRRAVRGHLFGGGAL